ncbi:hypothetical protein GCM10009663_57410 [Kitasatospora arboriphila]|uniref:Uncharacterized protein n=1 Tax=Kitasatospora arboriphila TaxID=258052 RepID=A0ABN1TXV7_9ACTN
MYRGATPNPAAPERLARFQLTQTAGPALAEITVTATSDHVIGLWAPPAVIGPLQRQPGPIPTGTVFTVDVAVDSAVTTDIPVVLTLGCVGQDDGTRWRRSLTGRVYAYPTASSTRRRLR